MPHVPPIERTKKRRDKLPAAGLIEKNVWVPAIFAAPRRLRAGAAAQGGAAIAHGPGFGWPGDLRSAATTPADSR